MPTGELASLDEQVNFLQRKQNLLVRANQQKREEVQSLEDRIRDLEKEMATTKANRQLEEDIARLTERQEKAQAKLDNANAIRRTYEQIHSRLLSDRIGYD